MINLLKGTQKILKEHGKTWSDIAFITDGSEWWEYKELPVWPAEINPDPVIISKYSFEEV